MNIIRNNPAGYQGTSAQGLQSQFPQGDLGFSPLDLEGLAAWYQHTVGITLNGSNVSQWDDQSGNGRDLIQSTATNQPRNLDHDGTNYLFLPGVAGNYASTPDAAALDIVGDLDLRCQVTLDDWTPSASTFLIAKFVSTGDERSFSFFVGTDGKLNLQRSENGIGVSTRTSTAATGFTNGTRHWVRVTMDVDAGSTDNDVTFLTSDNGVDWTQLGDVVNSAGVAAFFSSTAPLELGSRDDGTTNLASSKIYRAQFRDGIDGTVVFDADFTAEVDGTTSFTESSSEAATVTINQAGGLQAQMVSFASFVFDGVDNFMATVDFTLVQPETVFVLCKQIALDAGKAGRIFDGSSLNTGACNFGVNNSTLDLHAGIQLTPNNDLVLGQYSVVVGVLDDTGELQVNNEAPLTGDVGALNMGGFTLADWGTQDGARAGHIQVKEVILLSAVPDASAKNLVIDYLLNLVNL